MAQRQRAVSLCGLITPRSLNQNGLPVFLHTSHRCIKALEQPHNTHTHTQHRHGAGVARGAHNSEVTGSKPVAGIPSIAPALQKLAVMAKRRQNTATHFTGMAQRQRAGLITPRSLDRNGLPVFLHFSSFTEAAVA
jgi:hypothetical protein